MRHLTFGRILGRSGLRAAHVPALEPAPLRALQGESGAGAAIALSSLSPSYGSLRVLEGIDLSAKPGEFLSLVGPNCAAKTTLIRCIADGYERRALAEPQVPRARMQDRIRPPVLRL